MLKPRFTMIEQYEIIFIVSQKDGNGEWNSLSKSQLQWWDTKVEAVKWFDAQEQWFRDSNAVFEVAVKISHVAKVHDPYRGILANKAPEGMPPSGMWEEHGSWIFRDADESRP